MGLACFLNVDQDIVQIYHNKDVELFSEDFIDIAPKTGRSIGEPKKHNLILEVAVSNMKCSLSFVVFLNSHPEVGTE